MSGDKRGEAPVVLRPSVRDDARDAATEEAVVALRAWVGPPDHAADPDATGTGDGEPGGGGGLDAPDHEALLALTLGEEVAQHDAGERRAAARLRAALEGRSQSHEGEVRGLAEFAEALRWAAAPLPPEAEVEPEVLLALALGVEAEVSDEVRRQADAAPREPLVTAIRSAAGLGPELDELARRRLLRRALGRPASRPGGDRRWVVATGGALAALAAGVALWVGGVGGGGAATGEPPTTAVTRRMERTPPSASEAARTSRSTVELFDPAEPFAARGGESDRVERILASRASDLRRNRFAAWGVR
ncbi:MAG: hypothetical protein AAF928_13835 [Myxococcota bacterium]